MNLNENQRLPQSARKTEIYDPFSNQIVSREERLERIRNLEQVIVMINNDKFKEAIIFMK